MLKGCKMIPPFFVPRTSNILATKKAGMYKQTGLLKIEIKKSN